MALLEPVDLLIRQYLQLMNPEQLSIPAMEVLRLPEIQARIFDSMFKESAIMYPPPLRYRLRVLKRLVRALENSVEDPEEDVRFLQLCGLIF